MPKKVFGNKTSRGWEGSSPTPQREFGYSQTGGTKKLAELKSKKFEELNYRIFELFLSPKAVPKFLLNYMILCILHQFLEMGTKNVSKCPKIWN